MSQKLRFIRIEICMDGVFVSNPLTQEEVAERLLTLTDDDLLKIEQMSRAWSTGLRGWDSDDLIQEALNRVMDGRRKIPSDVNFLYGIAQVIRSLADGFRKRDLLMASEDEAGDPTDEHNAFEQLEDQQIFEELENRLDPGSNAARVLNAYREGYSKDETCELLSIDKRKYAAARKRIDRAILSMRQEENVNE